MKVCTRCSAVLLESATKCVACGLSTGYESAETAVLPNDPQADTPTKLETGTKRSVTTTAGSGRFVSGSVLAGRYRIIGLIGKGGMGEVYKAEDLELENTVALKFLPEELAKNEELLRRFRGEVRNARQVSHANVCRVFDIGETEGLYYLTMEYIDGDDLSMLLKRIGRFPSDRAVRVSRQICMGLAAIHKAGILHRDLKPANIIIDSKGEARITDFGIAGLESEIEGIEAKIGTPAYMSPEQADGKELTKQSDIYSLGLLLYEIFTGKQAYEGDSVQELRIKHATTSPTNPSEIVAGIDPLVEKVINRCLEKEPTDRTDSALRVAMSLPGGDPLQVALEAGETPTPEMVAAAPSTGKSRPVVLALLLIGFFGIYLAVAILQSRSSSLSYAPISKSREVLTERLRGILKNLGYGDSSGAEKSRFATDWEVTSFFTKQDDPSSWIEKTRKAQPAYAYFSFRQAPTPMFPLGDEIHITEVNPPLTEPGMVLIKTDVAGNLIEFSAVQTRKPLQEGDQVKTDWDAVFREAGLDRSAFNTIELIWTPPEFADEVVAWEGSLLDHPDVPVKIEGAGLQGKPVYFRVVPPWKKPRGAAEDPGQSESRGGFSVWGVFYIGLYFAILVSALLLVRNNLKNRRTDIKGAAKISGFLFVAYFVRTVLESSLPLSLPSGIWGTAFYAIAWGLFNAFLVVVFYLAVEPLVRRRWPEILISWNRLIAGGFRDPLVGRDLLTGLFVGASMTLAVFGLNYLSVKVGNKSAALSSFYSSLDPLNGIAPSVAGLLRDISWGVIFSFVILLLVLLMAFIFRRKWVAVLAGSSLFLLPWTLEYFMDNDNMSAYAAVISFVISFAYPLVTFLVLVRYGIVAIIAIQLSEALGRYVVVPDTSRPDFAISLSISLIPVALAIYAFHTSMAGRPLFTRDLLKDFK